MSKRRSRIGAALFAASLCLGFSQAARAEIKIGFITSMTGAASSIGIPYSKGMATGLAAIGEVGGREAHLYPDR